MAVNEPIDPHTALEDSFADLGGGFRGLPTLVENFNPKGHCCSYLGLQHPFPDIKVDKGCHESFQSSFKNF